MKSPINTTSEEWHQIEAYLDQENVSERLQLMNEELSQIPNLTQKIEEVKKVREEIENSIKQSKIKEFHKDIQIGENDLNSKNLSNKNTKSNAIWYAIAALLLVLLGLFWMMDNSNPSEKIFAENFKPDIGLPLKMSATDNPEFYEGMVDYKQENYKEAIAKWEVLIKDNSENDTLNYFLGVANLALGNADISLKFLQNEARFQQGIFKEDAAYYTALAKIKKGEFKEAKTLLKKYPSDRNTKLLNLLQEQ